MKLRKDTKIVGVSIHFLHGGLMTRALAETDNGVGILAVTNYSDLDVPDKIRAIDVVLGRIHKALVQYRNSRGRVTARWTGIIPERSMKAPKKMLVAQPDVILTANAWEAWMLNNNKE